MRYEHRDKAFAFPYKAPCQYIIFFNKIGGDTQCPKFHICIPEILSICACWYYYLHHDIPFLLLFLVFSTVRDFQTTHARGQG